MISLIFKIITLPLAIVMFVTLGICELIYSGNKDASNDKKFEQIMSKTVELKKDMFFARRADSDVWNLEFSGKSFLPASFEDFERDPKKWMNIDSNGKNNSAKQVVAGIVRSGTKLTVIKVVSKRSLFNGNRQSVFARIEDGEFSGRVVKINSIFDSFTLNDNSVPVIKENFALISI